VREPQLWCAGLGVVQLEDEDRVVLLRGATAVDRQSGQRPGRGLVLLAGDRLRVVASTAPLVVVAAAGGEPEAESGQEGGDADELARVTHDVLRSSLGVGRC
jgi:hypothetical protein